MLLVVNELSLIHIFYGEEPEQRIVVAETTAASEETSAEEETEASEEAETEESLSLIHI